LINLDSIPTDDRYCHDGIPPPYLMLNRQDPGKADPKSSIVIAYETTARMRRTPAEEDCSLTILKRPISLVF
jgi:hypothetical protein